MLNSKKIKEFLFALAMLAFGGGAAAGTVSLGAIGLSGISPYNVNLPESGPFGDSFTFTLGAGNSLLLGLVTSFPGYALDDAPIFSIQLSGGAGAGNFTPVLNVDSDMLFADLLLGGLDQEVVYTLGISGTESGNLGWTYSLHLAANTVPEPETLLLILVSLGMLGVTTLRKNNTALVLQ
jgi:hypothetical protein